MTCAFGRYENACITASALLGGHVRVGFENNLLTPDGRMARDKAQLVATASATVVAIGGWPATADELRSGWSVC